MSIKQKMAKGAGWMIGVRLMNRGIGFFSTIILARLLVPADFGLVAMAMVMVTLLQVVNAYSIQIFLVQKEDLKDEDLNTAWTLQIFFGVFQALILLLLSLPAAKFYEEPRLISVYWALAGMMFIYGFKNIGVMYFQREMRFHMEFLIMGGRKLAMFVTSVTLAIIFKSYWALIIGVIAGHIIEVILSYVFQNYRPRFCLSNWKEVTQFSKWLYLNNFLNFMRNRGSVLIIGKLSNAGGLGLFQVSYDLAMLPTTEMIAPINRAVFPGYANMKNDLARLQDGYLTVLGMITLVSLPAAFGIAAVADVLIPILLGNNWIEAIPLVQILAISGAILAMQTNIGSVFIATGRPWILLYLTTSYVFLLLFCVIVFILYMGILGACFAYLVSNFIMFPINIYAVRKILKFKIYNLVQCLYRPVLASLIMYVSVTYLYEKIIKIYLQNDIAICLLLIVLGFSIYTLSVLLFWLLAKRPLSSELDFYKLVFYKLSRGKHLHKNMFVKVK